MKRITFIIISLTLFFYIGGVYSQVSIYGLKGLHRVLEADPVNPTDIFVNGTFSMFIEKTGFESLSKYYNANLNATVGIAKYLECSLNIVPYQDDQYHIWGRFGDTRIGVKYLTPIATDVFKLGLMALYKFPTAEKSNVFYEVFSTSKPAWGINALFTFDLVDASPTFPLKINLNLGYMDHNVYDRYFQSKIDQLFIGTGFKSSIRSVQVYLEYSGEIFFNNPGVVNFGQNSMRLTPGVRFLGPWQNTIDVVADFTLTSYDSLKNTDRSFHKEYFSWKFTVGITHRFSVFKYFDKTAKLERKKQLEELRRLEEIRKKRVKASEDLEKMKDILDKKKPKEN